MTSKPHSDQQHDILGRVSYQPSKNIQHQLAGTSDSPATTLSPSTDLTFNESASPLKFDNILQHEQSATRPVSSIQFHTKYDNILLSSHGSRGDGKLGEPISVINVWSIEQAQQSQSFQRRLISATPITSMQLFPTSPTLVLGGTATGHLHLWDLRVKSSLPLFALDKHANNISSECHGKQAVTSICTPNNVTSPYFMTSSISGHVCKWTLSQLNTPLSQSFTHDPHDPTTSDKVPIRSMDIPKSTTRFDTASSSSSPAPVTSNTHSSSPATPKPIAAPRRNSLSLFIGTVNGSVCRLHNDDDKSWHVQSQRGMHRAPINKVRAHPNGTFIPHLDDVIATCSYDWSFKVWHFRRECNQLYHHDNIANGAINDIAWSNAHPTVLCYGDDSGILGLHDLSGHLRNESTANSDWKFIPPHQNMASTSKTRSSNHNSKNNSSGSTGKRPPITTVRWSPNKQFVSTGDKLGRIALWSTTSHMASLPDSEWLVTQVKSKIQKVG